MDEKMDKEQISRMLEELGIDVHTERFKTEISYLTTLFEQGQTVAEALQTVNDIGLRHQLKPALYYITLHALVIALARLQVITPEQAGDFAEFLRESTGIPANISRQDNVGNGQ